MDVYGPVQLPKGLAALPHQFGMDPHNAPLWLGGGVTSF
jgi:hypothetical protein